MITDGKFANVGGTTMRHIKRIARFMFVKLPLPAKLKSKIETVYALRKDRQEERTDEIDHIAVKSDLGQIAQFAGARIKYSYSEECRLCTLY